MAQSEKYKKALAFATKKHTGQIRIGGLPYISHPVAVAELLEKNGYGEDYLITALFHDLLEDTDATEDEILALGGPDVLAAVKLLTKKKGYIMSQYISAIKENNISRAVKAADRLHNLQSAMVTNDDFKRKYIKESIDWYTDFDPEIPKAIDALVKTLDNSTSEI